MNPTRNPQRMAAPWRLAPGAAPPWAWRAMASGLAGSVAWRLGPLAQCAADFFFNGLAGRKKTKIKLNGLQN